MRYVLVDPFSHGTASGAPTGISTYSHALASLLEKRCELHVIANPERLGRLAFREVVRGHLRQLGPEQLIVEAPESRAPLLDLAPEFFTHVRVHCPSALAQYLDRAPVDLEAFREELRSIEQASIVSAPSFAMADELTSAIPNLQVHVWRNPIPIMAPLERPGERNIDVLFLTRNQRLKGIDYVPSILRTLPENLRVVIAGHGAEWIPTGSPRCSVTIVPGVGGPARLALLRRARVLMLPSRFESFSMVLVEALACGVPVVSWSIGAPPELAPPPFVRVAPLGNTRAFSHLLLQSLEDPPIPQERFDPILAELHESSLRGIEFVIQSARGDNESCSPPPPDHRATHPYPPTPGTRLKRLRERRPPVSAIRSISKSMNDLKRVTRKINKLRRDPKAFLRDSRNPFLNRLASSLKIEAEATSSGPDAEPIGPSTTAHEPESESTPTANGTSKKASASVEPRCFAQITVGSGGSLSIVEFGRKIAEPDLATAVFIPRAGDIYRRRPFLGELLAAKDFVGYRDRYLFVVEYDLGGRYKRSQDIEPLFRASPRWQKPLLGGIRNAVFVDPDSVLPLLVRSTDHNVRLIVFLSADQDDCEALLACPPAVDVAISTSSKQDVAAKIARRSLIAETDQWPKTLQRVIIDHKKKEKNMLLPVIGDCGLIADIDELSSRNIDGLINLRSQVPTRGLSFRDYITDISERVDSILLREERYLQYRDYCDRGDVLGLLTVSLEDGCRYEVRA